MQIHSYGEKSTKFVYEGNLKCSDVAEKSRDADFFNVKFNSSDLDFFLNWGKVVSKKGKDSQKNSKKC